MKWKQDRLPGIPLCHEVEEPHANQDKLDTGCLPSQLTSSLHTCPTFAHSSEGNSKGVNLGFCTGSSLLRSRQSNPFSECVESLAPSTPSPPGRPPQLTTSGKMRRMSTGRGLNSERSRSKETMPNTGKKCGITPSKGTLWKYPRTSEFRIIAPCERLLQTLRFQLEWSELALYSGVELGLASRGELGKKLEAMLTLRIPYPSSGVATMVKKTVIFN